MGKEVILRCDICRKKDAHELPVWFEWETSYRSVSEYVVQDYISGISSRGWARYKRAIYLCKDHHDKLDTLITEFVKEQVSNPAPKPKKGKE